MKAANPDEESMYRARQTREGKKGGKATLARHGTEFYSAIAKKRWKAALKTKKA